MTIAPFAPPTYPLCAKGEHVLSPTNRRSRPSGTWECKPCRQEADRERWQAQKNHNETTKARMLMLLTGFAYEPKDDWYASAQCRPRARQPRRHELFDLADADSRTSSSTVSAVNSRRHEKAREFCEACPVVAQCLGHALTRQEEGTWGGELLTAEDWTAARQALKEAAK